MKIVGMMALSNFPYWEKAVRDLMQYCDKMYFRFDGRNGNPEIVNQLEAICGDKFGKCLLLVMCRYNDGCVHSPLRVKRLYVAL